MLSSRTEPSSLQSSYDEPSTSNTEDYGYMQVSSSLLPDQKYHACNQQLWTRLAVFYDSQAPAGSQMASQRAYLHSGFSGAVALTSKPCFVHNKVHTHSCSQETASFTWQLSMLCRVLHGVCLQEYAALKKQLLDNTRKSGGAIGLYLLLTVDGQAALLAMTGAAASYGYLLWLCRDVDNVRPTDEVPIWEANKVGGLCSTVQHRPALDCTAHDCLRLQLLWSAIECSCTV